MVGSGIKKFGNINNLRVISGSMTGNYKGYFINLDEGLGFKRIAIAAYLKDKQELYSQLQSEIRTIGTMNIISVNNTDNCIEVIFRDNLALKKKYYVILDYIVDKLRENNIIGNDYCSVCGEVLESKNYSLAKMSPIIMPVHNDCLDSFNNSIEDKKASIEEEEKNNNKSYLKGFVGAIIGGLIGTIPWIILYQMGYVAAYAAVLIGIGANYGYKIMGGSNGSSRMPIIFVSILFVFGAGLLIQYYTEIFIAFYDDGITVSELPQAFLFLLENEPEYKSAIVSNTLMSILFAGIGIFGYIRYLKQRKPNHLQVGQRL